MNAMLLTILPLQETLTFHRIIENIPRNPAAIFVYLLLAVSIALIVLGSRRKDKPSV
jgi:hypothetical protein